MDAPPPVARPAATGPLGGESAASTPGASPAVALGPLTADEFAAWLRPHLPALWAYARRRVGPDTYEDVVQDAIVRAWERRTTFDPNRGSAGGWLTAIVRDQARRSRRRWRPTVLLGDAVDDLADTAGAAAGRADDLDLDTARQRLTTRRREVDLFYVADLPVADVARVLGITASAVTSHLQQARARLRTEWENRRGR